MQARVANCNLLEILDHNVETGNFIGSEQAGEVNSTGGQGVEMGHGEDCVGVSWHWHSSAPRVVVKIRIAPTLEGRP